MYHSLRMAALASVRCLPPRADADPGSFSCDFKVACLAAPGIQSTELTRCPRPLDPFLSDMSPSLLCRSFLAYFRLPLG